MDVPPAVLAAVARGTPFDLQMWPALWSALGEDRVRELQSSRFGAWKFAVEDDGRIRPLGVEVSWTRRLYIQGPPLQNLSRDLRALVHSLGKVVLCADWSSLASRVVACLSGDAAMQASVSTGIYSEVARVLGAGRDVVKRDMNAVFSGGRRPAVERVIARRWPQAWAWLEETRALGARGLAAWDGYEVPAIGGSVVVPPGAIRRQIARLRAGEPVAPPDALAVVAATQGSEASMLRWVLDQWSQVEEVAPDVELLLPMHDSVLCMVSPENLRAAAAALEQLMLMALPDEVQRGGVVTQAGPTWGQLGPVASAQASLLDWEPIPRAEWIAAGLSRVRQIAEAPRDERVLLAQDLLAEPDDLLQVELAAGWAKADMARVLEELGGPGSRVRQVLRPVIERAQADAASLTLAEREKSADAVRALQGQPTLGKVGAILAHDMRIAGGFARDERTGDVLIRNQARNLLGRPTDLPPILRDEDITALRQWLGKTYQVDSGKDTTWDAVMADADVMSINSVQRYLGQLEWDGTPRLDQWLVAGTGCEDTPLHRAYGRKWLIAAVARAMLPGCKVDNILLLIGEQGIRKSSLFNALVPDPEWFVDSHFDINNKDAYLQVGRAWIYEVAEFESFSRSEIERVKAFITNRKDTFRAPFGRATYSRPRHTIFAATSNSPTPLRDKTGNRRFWPVRSVGIDLSMVEAWRDQLWAEAMAAFRSSEEWYLPREMEALRAREEGIFLEVDPWEDAVVSALLDLQRAGRVYDDVIMSRDLSSFLDLEGKDWASVAPAVARTLQALGFEKQPRRRIDGGRGYPWVLRPGVRPPWDSTGGE